MNLLGFLNIFCILYSRGHDILRNNTQHNSIQQNEAQHNDIQHHNEKRETQHNSIQ
jgi:hypothetical protein